MDWALIAAVGSGAGLLAMILFRAVTALRDSRTSVDTVVRRGDQPGTLKVSVGPVEMTIDLNAIDTEDPSKLEETIKAVRNAREVEKA